MTLRLTVSLILSIALGGAASAAEGRIPLLSLPGPPYVITQPGHYILTRDIGPAPGATVVIQSDGVTLDLGGYTVFGPSSFADFTIRVSLPTPAATRGIVIRNGRTVSGASGVALAAPPARVRIEDLEATESLNGISGSADHVEIVRCHIHDLGTIGGGGGTGISISARGGRVVDNLIQNSPGYGMSLAGFRAGDISRNVVRNFGSAFPDAAGISLEDISGESESTDGAVIADNVVSGYPDGTDDYGLFIRSDTSRITGNVMTRNGRSGMLLVGTENRLERNVMGRNGGDGIRFGVINARNVLEGNQAHSNTGCGFYLAATVMVILRDNTLGNNTGGNLCLGPGTNAGGNYCDSALCP